MHKLKRPYYVYTFHESYTPSGTYIKKFNYTRPHDHLVCMIRERYISNTAFSRILGGVVSGIRGNHDYISFSVSR